MLEAFFGFLGALAIAAIAMVREWPLTLVVSAFVLAEFASIWLLVTYIGKIIDEIKKRKSK